MPEYNIKISELNIVTPQPPFTEDFFPLVHSASMTTYRATIQDIGSLMTHSIFADTCSTAQSASHTNFADSASHANFADSASYALSASHALLADSASFYPPVDTVISCSWASRSIQSWYSTRSLDVDTHGVQYHFPFWTSDTPGSGNGNLSRDTMIVYYPKYSDTLGLVTLDSASTNLGLYAPAPIHRPDYQISRFNDRANVGWGFAGNVGIQTAWPIISHIFTGTDQRDWYFTGSATPHTGFDPDLQVTNSYFSGSAGDASSGSFYTIPTTPGSIASIFNGKWVRFVSNGGNPGGYDNIPSSHVVADHASMGEMWANADQTMKGLVSIEMSTAESNSWNKIDFWVHGTPWAGNQSVTILHVHNYGLQQIRAIRVSTKPGGVVDPTLCIDMLIDGLFNPGDSGTNGDSYIRFRAQSWQGIRFLKWLNVDPWPFENTGSNDITQDGTQLICPAAPGYYSNSPKSINYNIQGKNVVIWPNYNEITQSGGGIPSLISSHSLHVSGTINTNTHFACDNHPGIFTTVTYGTINLYFSGGILVGKYPPDGPPVTPPVACGAGPFIQKVAGNIDPDHVPATSPLWHDYTYTVGYNAGQITLNYNANANHVADRGDPCRWQLIYNGNVVQDTDWKGFSHTIFGSPYPTYEAAELAELSNSLAPHAIPGATYGWPNTIPSPYIPGEVSGIPIDIYPKGSGSIYWYKPEGNPTTVTVRVLNPLEDPCSFTMSCPGQTIGPP